MTTPSTPDDVNERVVAEWVEETTPFERVRTVMKRTYEPQPVREIADHARTSEKTARKHLRQLAEGGFVEETAAPEQSGALYRRSPESLVLEQAHDILDEVDSNTLVERISEMQTRIREYREASGADSPEDAAVRGRDVDEDTVQDWQTTRRNLGFARVALAVSEAEDVVQMERVG